jgi:hypothetical protein
MAALAIGFAAESVGWRVVGGPSTGQRTESALRLVFETIRPKSLDHHASLVRVASLETEFSLNPSVEEWEQSASTGRHASFGERSIKNSLRLTSALPAGKSLAQKRRTAKAMYSTMHTCRRPLRGSTHRKSLHRPLCHRQRAPQKTGCDCGGIEAFDLTGRRIYALLPRPVSREEWKLQREGGGRVH